MKTKNYFKKVRTRSILLAFTAVASIPLFAQNTNYGTGSGTGGNYNSFFGVSAGTATTSSGVRNVFFGHYTGATNTTGEQNSFVGCLAGYNNTTGSFNAFFGERAGASNTTGGANTYSGYLCGQLNTTGAYNTFTGHKAGYNNTASTNSFYGNESGYANTSGSGNAFYGNQSGMANTTASYNSFYGMQSGKANTTGANNSFYGNASGTVNTTGAQNSFYGNESGKANTTGGQNSFYGHQSGMSNTTANGNSFYGYLSGRTNTTGGQNSFYGYESGKENTTGFSNSFNGSGSGKENTTGYGNSFYGVSSGQLNTTGYYNVFVGAISGISNQTGYENTYVGEGAGYYGQENGNSALGFFASPASYVNYSTAIGHQAYVTTDYTIALGDANDPPLPITVVIGKTARSGYYSLETNGDIYVNGNYYPSDKNFKKNIENYTNALDVINKLRPVSYFFKDDVYFPQEKGDNSKPVKRNFAKEEQIGFIAQELEQVLPNMVRTDKHGFKAVNYDMLFGVLTQGVKEQDVKITALETQNKELMNKLDAVNALLLSQQGSGNATDTKGGATQAKVNGYISSVTPNPFSTSTSISYVIPENYKQASISVVSEMGVQAAQIAIKESGKGMFVFVGETLQTGSYYCYLNVDGVIVDYKHIVLTK